ncbi:MAG TPA: MFS transporter [Blastocatellia bacterium]|jgi:ACS family glucarate transporter-like MFS transporter
MTPAEPAAAKDVSLAPPALKESPWRWGLMILLVAAMLFCYAQRNALSVASKSMADDLGFNPAKTGLLLSSFFWIYAFMQIPSGWLVDRFGVRRTYAFSFVFWSFMSALTGLTNGLATLILFRVLMGTGQSVAFPASSRAVANWFQESERGLVTGLYLAGVRFGGALISIFGGWFLTRYDWRWFFVAVGAVSLVWVAPWMGFLKKWETSGTEPAPASTWRASFMDSLALLKNRSALGLFLGFFAYNYVWNVFQNWLPNYLETERKFTKAEMGVLNAMPLVAMSVIIMISGALSDWLIRRGYEEKKVRKIFIAVGMLICCLIVPAGFVEDRMTAVWLLTVSLSGLGVASPNTWTLTQAVSPKKIVGTVSGIQNFGGNVGAILAPMLTGFIAHFTGSFALALALCGVILVAGVIVFWFVVDEKVEIRE